ncbi:unnamed protein product [Sphagnum tenellum]
MNVSKRLSMRLKMAHVANQIHDLLEMLMLGLQSFILANYARHIVTVLVMGIPNQSHVLTTRGQLFDTVEEGGLRASAPYVSSTEIAEQENERGLDTLHDRVNVLKRLTADIHGEVDSHNRLLDGMASAMDASRGIMSGTMNQFKRVFETKSTRTIFTIVGTCVVVFFLVYYLTK